MHSDIFWLTTRWHLPCAAAPLVEALLASEKNGGTALALTEAEAALSPGAWGRAAAPSDGPNGHTPLVLFAGKNGTVYLQSRVLHEAEGMVAKRLRQLAGSCRPIPSHGEAYLDELFPGAAPSSGQVAAARLAAQKALTILTGGPGTGKTYTLARILALLVEGGIAPEKFHLAAPTGKAAQRMREAVMDAMVNLPRRSSTEELPRIAQRVRTLHQLLGYHPGTGRCRTTVLPEGSVVVLDECSMIDLMAWAALARILPDDARLILLGDPEQLESVGQGAVFAALAQAASLATSRVHLTETHRFREAPGIQGLAQAILQRDAEAACALLEQALEGKKDAKVAGLSWYPVPGHRREGGVGFWDLPDFVREAYEAIAYAATAVEGLANLSQVGVLAAHRETPWGAHALSQRIQAHFQADDKARFFPIIIERNDPATGLKNGTVGILESGSAQSAGEKRAYFCAGQTASGELVVQVFPESRLPQYQPAWAITIHRSQGSEYAKALVILPREDSPLATRELLYTAMTRARGMLGVCGDLETVRRAVQSKSSRCTLLGLLLEEGAAA